MKRPKRRPRPPEHDRLPRPRDQEPERLAQAGRDDTPAVWCVHGILMDRPCDDCEHETRFLSIDYPGGDDLVEP